MDDRTESFESYEPDSYEWDYEEARDRGPKVLWGRIIALGLFLLMAFLVGRWSAPPDTSEAALRTTRADLAAAENEIESLQEQLDQGAVVAEPSATPTTDESPAETSGEEQTYVVQDGDTLADIAIKFYDDPQFDDLIADANGIEDPTSIRPGQKLVIPPRP
ncbi:MAG: LysM peptidoglycan-binding domain-containing protein [Actinomycetota bacterium]